jgi:glycosyltransferase involved in cell wall biosynthesis
MTSPIRVRALYTRYPHWGAHAGMNQVVRYLDPAHVRARLQPISDNDKDLPLPHPGLRRRLKTRVQARGMAWYKLSDLNAELRLLPGCVTNAIDVVHYLDAEHSAQYLPTWLRRARASRTKTVATYHQPPDLLPTLVNPEIVATLDHVIVVSPVQVPFFRQALPEERIDVVLHGIDTDFFTPRAGLRTEGPFRCATAGHWLRDWTAVRAVATALPGVEFHVVTDRDTGLAGLKNVVTHQNVDDATLRSVYQQSDALFLPLTQSNANNSLLEGIACCLPVVSTDLPSIRAYLPGREAFLIANNDPAALTNAVERLVRDADLRAAMAAAARRRAEELSWPNVAREVERIYQRLVNGRAS